MNLVQTRRAKEQLEDGELFRLAGPILITEAAYFALIEPAARKGVATEAVVEAVRKAWREGWQMCGSGAVPDPAGGCIPLSFLVHVEPYTEDRQSLVVFLEEEWED